MDILHLLAMICIVTRHTQTSWINNDGYSYDDAGMELEHIENMDQPSRHQCFLNEHETLEYSAWEIILYITPDKLLNLDLQCKEKFGDIAFVCKSVYQHNYASVCSDLFCAIPGLTECRSMKPEDGTLCGNKKWCYDGRCRYSSWAPEINDCSLGDISTNCKKDQCPVYSVTQRMNCCQTCPQALKENMTDLTDSLKTTYIYIPTSTKKTETARTTTRLSPVSFTATSDPGVTQAATSLSSEPRSTTSRPVSKTLSSATKNSPRTLTTTSSDGSTIQRRENGGGSGSKADQNVGIIIGTSIAAVLIAGTAILVTVVCVVRHRFSKSRTVSLSNQPANAVSIESLVSARRWYPDYNSTSQHSDLMTGNPVYNIE